MGLNRPMQSNIGIGVTESCIYIVLQGRGRSAGGTPLYTSANNNFDVWQALRGCCYMYGPGNERMESYPLIIVNLWYRFRKQIKYFAVNPWHYTTQNRVTQSYRYRVTSISSEILTLHASPLSVSRAYYYAFSAHCGRKQRTCGRSRPGQCDPSAACLCYWTDFREIWYERYALGGHSKI